MAEIETKGADAYILGRKLAFDESVHAMQARLSQIYAGVENIQAALAGVSPLAPIGYSASEQAVPGVTWIDGSQVYQITLVGATGSVLNTYNLTGRSIPNLGTLISMAGEVVNGTGSQVPVNHLQHTGFCFDFSGNLQEMHDNANYSSKPFTVTVLYTKAGG